MHFVNASQIGQRKFFGNLSGNKNPAIRSPLKGRKENESENDGCCTKAVAWLHIALHFSLIITFLVILFLLVLNGQTAEKEIKDNPERYGYYLWKLNSSNAGIKAVIILFAFCLAGSILGLTVSIFLLKGERERSTCKLKLWTGYTIIICCLCVLFSSWTLISSKQTSWEPKGRLLVFVVVFLLEVLFLYVVTTFMRKIQTAPPPAPEALISDV